MVVRYAPSAGLAMILAAAGMAQVEFTGRYSQDFDGLWNSGNVTMTGKGPHALSGIFSSTGVDGWFGANFAGSSADTEFKAQDGSQGSSGGRGVISFGTTSSTERALGGVPTGNQGPTFGLVLTNATSQTYVSLDIAFTGEQWRAGGAGIPNVLAFSYGIGANLADATTPVPELTFNTPILTGGEVALNGNDPANQTALSATITGINWGPGQTIVLRWEEFDMSGQDNGLAIDDLSMTGKAGSPSGIKDLNLNHYELAATYALPSPSASEASAVTYNWDTGTLFVLGDEGDALVEVTTSGQPVSEMSLTSFEDTEGLTYIGNSQFVIVEERLQDVFLLTYVPGGTVDRSELPGLSLGETVGNVGLEGITFDPSTGHYVLVKEKTPQQVLDAVLDWRLPAGSAGELFVPDLGVADLSDLQAASTVPSLIGTRDQDSLLILSQESQVILEVDRSGNILSSFSFAGIATNAEGITIGPDGTIYVVGENPSLYVLTPTFVPPCPSDINGDGTVDGADLGLLLADWGRCQ